MFFVLHQYTSSFRSSTFFTDSRISNTTTSTCATPFLPKLSFWILASTSAFLFLTLIVFLILGILGHLRYYKLQKCFANCFVVIPANCLIVSSYFLLTPLRWIFARCMNSVVTAVVSLGTSRPGFWNANYETLLKAFPVGYKGILNGKEILEMTEDECQAAMTARTKEFPLPCIRRCIARCGCSSNVINSFPVRLFVNVTLLPILSWWLNGFVCVPFVQMPSTKERGKHTRVEAKDLTQDERGTPDTPDTLDTKTLLLKPPPATPSTKEVVKYTSMDVNDVPQDERTSVASSASVRLFIPKCKFLQNARKLYGKAGGNRACVNE